jgi:hypothetical protein
MQAEVKEKPKMQAQRWLAGPSPRVKIARDIKAKAYFSSLCDRDVELPLVAEADGAAKVGTDGRAQRVGGLLRPRSEAAGARAQALEGG